MDRALHAVLLVAALAAPATASPPAAALRPVDVSRGRALAERSCGMCHATGAMGSSPNAAAPPFRSLSRRYPMDMLANELRSGMLTGHPDMPAFRFAPSDIDDLIAYLKSLQTGRRASAAPAEVRRQGASSVGR